MTKLTKKEKFALVRSILDNTASAVSDEVIDELIEFCDKEIANLNIKATKAKERAAEKKAEGDALKDSLADVLTSEFATIPAILEALGDEEISSAKAAPRLSKLVAEGVAEKGTVDKKVAYRLA